MDITNIKPDRVSKPEIENVEREKQEYKLVGKYLRTRGLKLFVYSSENNELYEVDIEKESTLEVVSFDLNQPIVKDTGLEKVTINTNHTLFEALNFKSAQRRVDRFLSGKISDLCNLREPSQEGIKLY